MEGAVMTLVTVPTLIYGADDKADKAEDQLRHPTFPEKKKDRDAAGEPTLKYSLNANSSALFFVLRCS